MQVDASRVRQVLDICRELFECHDDELESRLTQSCGDDADLRREVRSLLARDRSAGQFLEPPSSAVAAQALEDAGKIATPGERVGRYTIQRELGRGGMGVVYAAEQDEPRRIVALKLVRSTPFTDELSRQLLRREAQALARLNHRSIAAIYEAGTEGSLHYFAMEHVAGAPLTRFARERSLTVSQRIELFRKLCDAVHYAHQRGVIHRDLKPSNILVTESGLPKVLDFGLSRIIGPEIEHADRSITRDAVVGTLAYMSPEQARGGESAVDTRSDIYSLGVILYELLSGHPPYSVSNISITEATRVICEFVPPAPGVWQRECRGDLSTVTLTALRKDPRERYPSAAALGEDLHRAVTSQPITAHPPSGWYQFRKLITRHKLLIGLASALVIVLATSAASLAWFNSRLVAQRDAAVGARSEEAEARASSEAFVAVLSDLLNSANPDWIESEEPTLRQVLDRAYGGVTKIEHRVARARLMTVMGQVYARLEDADRAQELLKSAVDILQVAPGDNDKELTDALLALAFNVRSDDADELATKALQIRRERYGDQHPLTAAAWNRRGEIRYYARNFEDALADFSVALAIWEGAAEAAPGDVANAAANCGASCTELGRLDEAEAYLTRAVAMTQQLDDRGAEFLARENLAKLVWRRDPQEAAKQFVEIVSLARGYYRPNHPRLGWHIRNCAFVLSAVRGAESTEPLFEEAVAIHRAAYDGDHRDLSQSLDMLGTCYADLGKLDEAAAMLEDALAMRQHLLGPQHVWTLNTEAKLTQVRERLAAISPPDSTLDE